MTITSSQIAPAERERNPDVSALGRRRLLSSSNLLNFERESDPSCDEC
jgi:hypothetical protein